MTLGVFWQTAFVRWVVEGKVTLQPLTRAELQVVQKKLPGAAIAEKSAAFLAYVKAQYNLSAAEAEALQALAEFSREKVEEIVAIDGVATAELRFIEGVLVTA
jgi:hypothetical protein